MANVRLTALTNNAACDSVVDRIDTGGAGTIEIRSGTQPATADTSATGTTLLGTLTFSATAFGGATGGVATASTITGDSSADADGTATWARIKNGSAATVYDCDVGTTGATINLNSVAITTGGTIDITSFTMTHPDGT